MTLYHLQGLFTALRQEVDYTLHTVNRKGTCAETLRSSYYLNFIRNTPFVSYFVDCDGLGVNYGEGGNAHIILVGSVLQDS
jgi:hypothetical protein